jgi:hypothetical protein
MSQFQQISYFAPFAGGMQCKARAARGEWNLLKLAQCALRGGGLFCRMRSSSGA